MTEQMNHESIQLYTAATIDSLDWPATPEGDYAKKFLTPLIKEGVNQHVENVNTVMMILKVDHHILPMTINDSQYNNSFVCSPYGQYISLAYDFVDKLKSRMLVNSIRFFLGGFEKIMHYGKINKVVIVNNWLLTTNPPLKISESSLKKMTNFLTEHFPDHAIGMRSILKATCKNSFHALKNHKFHFIPSRQVYLTDASNESIFKTRVFKSDLKFLKECGYQLVHGHELTSQDVPHILKLYQALYIKKYSELNPQWSLSFIHHALKNQVLEFKALKKNQEIIGVVGYFCHQGAMISPFFGYDPSNSENQGVYRALSTILLQEAQSMKSLFNQGAGGSFYKKIRRAQGEMEYLAIHHQHLPLKRRMPWQILKAALSGVGAYFMRKY